MGAWLPVTIVGVGAIVIVFGVILLDSILGGDSDSETVEIPERTVATEGRTLGSEDARVTIEEYTDFQCPFCGRAARTIVPQIEQEYIADGRVKLVFHNMAFEGPESVWAAEAAECANDQGKFWDYHDKLFGNQRGQNQGAFAIDNLKRFADELELDTEAFNQCIDSHKYEELVTAERQEAADRGLDSVPTFIIGEQTVKGAVPYEEFQRVIEAELRKNP
jgi:protein-disulfide isomerase